MCATVLTGDAGHGAPPRRRPQELLAQCSEQVSTTTNKVWCPAHFTDKLPPSPSPHRDGQCTLAPPQLLAFCQDIAAAMVFLSHKGFIHRDLAARNILLDESTKCKARAICFSKHVFERTKG